LNQSFKSEDYEGDEGIFKKGERRIIVNFAIILFILWWWCCHHNLHLPYLKERLVFGGLKNSAPFPSMLVIFSARDNNGYDRAESSAAGGLGACR
jgi:hypothetical protein